MRNAHRRIGGIHMLPALATRSISVDPQILGLNDDLNAVINFRRNKDAGKRSMPPLGLIKRGNTDEPVHTDLPGQQTISVLASHREGSRFDPRFLPRLMIVDLRPEPLPLGPA